MKISGEDAVALLKDGKVVAVPTETVYGLAADALNPSAIAKIFEIKNRPADNPLICHFNSVAQVQKFVTEIPVTTSTLMHHFSPGPISFMLDLPDDSLLKFATCGSAQVIARMPDHPVLLDIIKTLDRPVAAPSANTSGRLSPTSAEMVEEDLGEKIAGVVEGGISTIGIESTIVDARNEREIFILRPGAVGETEIQKIFPHAKIISGRISGEQPTPGAKYRHYAPRTPVFIAESFEKLDADENIAVLMTEEQLHSLPDELKKKISSPKICLIILGSTNNLNELAKNFYRNLATLDHIDISKAFILKNDWDASSLGKALKDRVEKIISIT